MLGRRTVPGAAPPRASLLRVGLLNCEDDCVYGKPLPAMMNKWLELSTGGVELVAFDVKAGELPTPRVWPRYDGFIVGGSYSGAYEEPDTPWIQRLAATLRGMHAQRVPLLGICFGHQILAQSLGGTVAKSSKGITVPRREVTLVATSDLAKDLLGQSPPARVNLMQAHGDVVTKLPPDAVKIGTSEHNEYEMFATKDRSVLTFQAHPEFGASEYGRAQLLKTIGLLADKKLSKHTVASVGSMVRDAHTDDAWAAGVTRRFFAQAPARVAAVETAAT